MGHALNRGAGPALRPFRAVPSGRTRPCGHSAGQLSGYADDYRRWLVGQSHRHLGRSRRGVRHPGCGDRRRRRRSGVHGRVHRARRSSARRCGQGFGALVRPLRLNLGFGIGQRCLDRRHHPADDEAPRLSARARGRRRGGGLVRRSDHAAGDGCRRLHHGRVAAHHLQRDPDGSPAAGGAVLLGRLGRLRPVRPPLRP